MDQNVQLVTAETQQGKQAIMEIMQYSYRADIDPAKLEWAMARVVNGIPVSFIITDPDNAFELPFGTAEFGFVHDAATREDRRREGHFKGILEAAGERLRAANKPLMALHGEFSLYHQLGFAEYTTNLGIFVTPAKVLRIFGRNVSESLKSNLKTWEHPKMQEDLLVVPDVQSTTFQEAKEILQAAALVALEKGKDRILLNPAPQSSKTQLLGMPFIVMARACGGSVVVQGSDAEGRKVEHSEWVKLIDPAILLRQSLTRFHKPLPSACISFELESGCVTLTGSSNGLAVTEGSHPDAEIIKWPDRAFVQLALGYLPAQAISAIYPTSISQPAISMLESLFPSQWLFSEDESWVY